MDINIDWRHAALLIIDMQHDFAAPDGSAYIDGTAEIVPVVSHIAQAFRNAQRPVIHIVRLYLPDGTNADICRRERIASGMSVVAPYTSGAAILPVLLPDVAEQPDHRNLLAGKVERLGDLDYAVYKPRWGAFYRTPLMDFLMEQGIRSLVVVGCNFPNCPRTTVYEASERDFSLGIVPEALSGIYPKGLEELTNIGVNVIAGDALFAF
ncbi:isochorismatase family cysteine hydrolase [Parapedobacter lycopersici]|uniref:cysteine hydrolase family protein n=1 Tax=Parapedobacter lycopersici TaxID=1864939 RepID=UPI003342C188